MPPHPSVKSAMKPYSEPKSLIALFSVGYEQVSAYTVWPAQMRNEQLAAAACVNPEQVEDV